jgi:predicted RNase H-like HicB family nuclease
LTAAVSREESWYVAGCREVDVTSQGQSAEEALAKLREALCLYFEDQPLPVGLESPILEDHLPTLVVI